MRVQQQYVYTNRVCYAFGFNDYSLRVWLSIPRPATYIFIWHSVNYPG